MRPFRPRSSRTKSTESPSSQVCSKDLYYPSCCIQAPTWRVYPHYKCRGPINLTVVMASREESKNSTAGAEGCLARGVEGRQNLGAPPGLRAPLELPGPPKTPKYSKQWLVNEFFWDEVHYLGSLEVQVYWCTFLRSLCACMSSKLCSFDVLNGGAFAFRVLWIYVSAPESELFSAAGALLLPRLAFVGCLRGTSTSKPSFLIFQQSSANVCS